MTRTIIIEAAKGTIKQETNINMRIRIERNTTTNLVNPSVTEGMGRLRTLTIGTRAAKAIRVDSTRQTGIKLTIL